MTRLKRITNKIFGETASTTGTEEFGAEIGQFGSAKLGTYNATGDVATIQSLPAWGNGWIDAVIPNQQYPTLPEMTGVNKVLSYQTGYLHQEGLSEWDSATEYYKECYVKYIPETITYTASASIGTSTGITGASVDVDTFTSQITLQGNYTFTFDGSNWLYNEMTTNLTLYGITYTGTPVEDDEIIISLVKTITQNESKIYISNTDNNINNNPSTDAINWREFITGGAGSIETYCITSGNINSDGESDLLVVDSSVNLQFKVGNTFNALNGVYADGSSFVNESIDTVDCSTLADGDYNIFVDSSSTADLFNNTIYRQVKEPTSPNANDVWLDTSVKPYVSKKFNGLTWDIYNKVPFPQNITIASGVISSINKIGYYNDNGYNCGRHTLSGLGMPSQKYEDLTLGASGTTYIAPANGWFVLSKASGATGESINMSSLDTTLTLGLQTIRIYSSTSAQALTAYIPALKGSPVYINYTVSGATSFFRFVYAEGETK